MRRHGAAGIALTAALALLACTGASAPSRHVAPSSGSLADRAEALRSGGARVRALERPGWVEASATVAASAVEAPASVRARALAEARRAAVEFVAGVEVKSGLLSYEQVRGADASSLVQQLIATHADALIVDEQVVGSTMKPRAGDGYAMQVVLRARVLDRSGTSDPDFETELRLGQGRFLEGDEVVLAVRASRAARLYVIGITPEGAVLLLPNRHLSDTRVEAGEWLRFPDPDLEERGVRLRAQLPPGQRESTEALVVIAMRGDRELAGALPGKGRVFRQTEADAAGRLLADLIAPLVELPADAWTFDQAVYQVMSR